jgi:3-hydroxyethyl bacteriochlorophyllide a dehydrogenase
LDTMAVVLEEPGRLVLRRLNLTSPGPEDVVVNVAWTGVSTGTERLLFSGSMPPFPGLGYPLVPGYEAMGQIQWAGTQSGRQVGEWVFVPGSTGFDGARGLFGAAARRLVAKGPRVIPVSEGLGEDACLLALAATAQHAIAGAPPAPRTLVVGHGALGRLLARILATRADAPPPVVWETNPIRREGAEGRYEVLAPEDDPEATYGTIYDVSGDPAILDVLLPRLSHGGEVVLAGFYSAPVRFDFPPAFLREARLRVAAEWRPSDLREVLSLMGEGRLSLEGLVTHRLNAAGAPEAYEIAFNDPHCVKMILDWRETA